MVNDDHVDRSFAACAHPLRRAILERLADGEMTVGEATRGFPVSKPAVTKHLKVLEEAGAITRVVDGRTHRLRLGDRPFGEAWSWMEGQRRLWERKFDVVEEYLQEQNRNRARKDET